MLYHTYPADSTHSSSLALLNCLNPVLRCLNGCVSLALGLCYRTRSQLTSEYMAKFVGSAISLKKKETKDAPETVS